VYCVYVGRYPASYPFAFLFPFGGKVPSDFGVVTTVGLYT